MELRTCKNCRRLYNHFVGQNLCPACVSELDEIYRQVKMYVYDNPNASIQEVADKFNITIRTIHGWIREERLEFGNASLVGLPCESCGTTIKSGRFCTACKKTMVDGLATAFKEEKTKVEKEQTSSGNKMRFFG